MAFKQFIRGESPCKKCAKGHHNKCKKLEYCSCNCPNPPSPIRHNNKNSKKTHCLRGHELNNDNVYLTKENRRLCIKCVKIRRVNNIETIRKSAKIHYNKYKKEISMMRRINHKSIVERLKTEILTHYGNNQLKCICCDENNLAFLTIDHINNDGNEQRKIVRRTGHILYRYLKKNNLPDGYQTLCFNCNSGKAINKGICPHKTGKTIPIYIGNIRIKRLDKKLRMVI